MRYPANVFKNIIDLLGKTPAEVAALDKLHYPYMEKVRAIEQRAGVEVVVDTVAEEERVVTPEEVMAMFIKGTWDSCSVFESSSHSLFYFFFESNHSLSHECLFSSIF
jgi:hypothetical protein